MSPTARTLAAFRRAGYGVGSTEHWVAFGRKGGFRRDLFHCIDLVAVRRDVGLIGVQVTDATNVAKRVAKILDPTVPDYENRVAWVYSGTGLIVLGWKPHDPVPLFRRIIPDHHGGLDVTDEAQGPGSEVVHDAPRARVHQPRPAAARPSARVVQAGQGERPTSPRAVRRRAAGVAGAVRSAEADRGVTVRGGRRGEQHTGGSEGARVVTPRGRPVRSS